ncbi:hypothetical protein AOXY_G11701 [Acipenser oxyrinchus oxyrinchus]|uniref:G2 and S phase-expressed protein 1 N-terminal domain-containing protein n=1 Tax=Acipenser oxyrinchus oxyrinchus TaxID=40147 RepID=A0AAD8DD24_ACIOX|nr:hypothetical protein AOXY_G11701 [Acipenser oxyrinchus oxyrinchus]
MDSLDNDGCVLLTEEKFDFDLTLSPASVKDEDEDDEVFRIPLSKAVSSKAGGKSGHMAAEKPRTGIKSSSSRRQHNSSACSSEDLHSDNASIASDISESSLNGSILGKRTVPVSNKIGLRKSYGTKPAIQHRGVGVATRRNTSSSSLSSMNSSMNSSISVSPTGKGKTNTLVNNSLSKTKMQASSSGKRLAPPVAGGRLHTFQVKKVPVVASKLVKSASASSKLPSPARRLGSAAILQPHSPDDKEQPSSVLNVQSSAQQNKTTSDIKGSGPVFPKPKAFVAPTPTGHLKGPRYSGVPSPEAPRIMQPKRLMSCSNIGSTQASTTTDLSAQVAQHTPILGARSVSVTSSVCRSSALPTPVSRRFSGIPVMTPRTLPRTCRTSESAKVLLSDRRFSASTLQINEVKPQDRCQYDSLPREQSPPLQMVPCALDFSPEKPKAELHQVILKDQTVISPTKPCDALTETQLLRSAEKETLLVDIEVDAQPSVPKMEDRPLIDLSNTPDLINKSLPLKPTVVGQLIDLSSPLIKFCPVARKENEVESPLIKFTF